MPSESIWIQPEMLSGRAWHFMQYDRKSAMAAEQNAKDAWRLFNRNWLLLGVLASTLALCLWLTDFSVRINNHLIALIALAILFTAATYSTFGRFDSRIPFILGTLAQLELLSLLIEPLTYIAAATDLPMQDGKLASLDRMLGLDWVAYFNFIYDRPALIPYAYLGYAMILWPIFVIPVILGIAREYRRLQQFTLACALTLIATTLIFVAVPALGTYSEYGIAPDPAIFKAGAYLMQLHDLPLVRAGSLRVLNVTQLAGIITFPSFHAAAAILCLWALWCIWWLRPWALIANIGMLLVTPMVGGHYFVDVFAGAGLAVFAIAAAHKAGQFNLGAHGLRYEEAAVAQSLEG
jgi:hypothetical protein